MNIIPMANPSGAMLERIPDLVRVVNLRGTRKPRYTIPKGVEYHPAFLPGGPQPKIKMKDILSVCKTVLFRKEGTIVVHCEHGQNRTGLIFCLCSMFIRRCSPSQALEFFSTLRPPGIERQWAIGYLHRHGTLICTKLNSSQKKFITPPSSFAKGRRKLGKRRVIPNREKKNGTGHSTRSRGHRHVRKDNMYGGKSSKIYPEPKSQIVC